MKRFFVVVLVLSLVGTVRAERNPKYENWLTPDRLERWQSLSQDMDYTNLYTLMHELYYLPNTPFEEPLKQILFKMGVTYKAMLKDIRAGTPIIVPEFVAEDKCGEISGNLYEMMSWQDDPRFIHFQADFAGGLLAARGLARIGEPAFEAVIKAFEVKGYSSVIFNAAKTIELMMQTEDSFLRTDLTKYTIARSTLLRIAQNGTSTARAGAIDALRYFPDNEVSSILETISRTDPRMVNGRYPLRARAQEALEFMRAN